MIDSDKKDFVAFSLGFDETTDKTDQSQLAIFIRFIKKEPVVLEELLDLIALKDTIRGIDIKSAFESLFPLLPMQKLLNISTDGAPSMVGKKNDFLGRIRMVPTFLTSLQYIAFYTVNILLQNVLILKMCLLQ